MADQIIKFPSHLIKDAIRNQYENITGNLQPQEIIPYLYAKGILLLEEKQHLERIKDREGSICEAKALIDCILKKSDLHAFLDTLFKRQMGIYKIIYQTIQNIISGATFVLSKQDFSDLKEQLAEVYKYQNFHIIKESFPDGKDVVLNVKDNNSLMPVQFSTQVFDKDRQIYVEAKFTSIEAIACVMQQNVGSRSLLCTGQAGAGKSVMCRKLVSQWMENSNEFLHDFDFVIYIPIRDVDTDASFCDILDEDNLGYVTKGKKQIINACLSDPKIAQRCLIILDGVDEQTIREDSDLHQIMKAKMYPCVKLIVTNRPESPQDENHDYKVDIGGTTPQGVIRYLKVQFGCSTYNKSEKREIENFLQSLEQQLLDLKLLQTPLYLTIIGYIFQDYWKKHKSFKDYVIPHTATEIFNELMKHLVCVWLERLGRKSDTKSLYFKRSPVERNSQLPTDIQVKLIKLGEMSYNSLLKQQYTFSETDLTPYRIELDTIRHSGLFCFSTKEGNATFYFRHKQIQEFMAALFLVHHKKNASIMKSFLCNPDRIAKGGLTIQEVFGGKQLVAQFVFGLSPVLGADLLQELNGNVSVSSVNDICFSHNIHLHYEACLVSEANSENTSRAMVDLLLNSRPIEKPSIPFTVPLHAVYNLFKKITTEECKQLLVNWYGLYPDKENGKWYVRGSELVYDQLGTRKQRLQDSIKEIEAEQDRRKKDSGLTREESLLYSYSYFDSQELRNLHQRKLEEISKIGNEKDFLNYSEVTSKTEDLEIIKCLNDTLYFTLKPFQFQNIKTLKLIESQLTDVKLIQLLFPLMNSLIIYDSISLLDKDLRSLLLPVLQEKDDELSKTLNHVVLKTQLCSKLPVSSVESLASLPNLQTVKLNADVLTHLMPHQSTIQWSNLAVLHLFVWTLNDKNAVCMFNTIASLFKTVRNLESLMFGCMFNDTSATMQGDLKEIMKFGLQTYLPDLGNLSLFRILRSKEYMDLCCQLPNLSTIGFGFEDPAFASEDNHDLITNIIKSLPSMHNIQKFSLLQKSELDTKHHVTYICDEIKSITSKEFEYLNSKIEIKLV